tara:strand:- start:63 stop:1589 length:1527 start_codon:yes stop_codon:yes gene_type:complete
MSITKISPDVVDFDSGITISTADNTDTLTLTSTDADDNSGPNLNMFRNSASAADADVLGQVKFTGKNDAGSPEDIVYGSISGKISDASDSTEDGQLRFFTMAAGTSTQTLTLESGNVGIGTNSPATLLELSANNNSAASNNTLRFTDTDTATESNQQIGKIEFKTDDSSGDGALVRAYILSASEDVTPSAYISFGTNAGGAGVSTAEKMRIDGTGFVGINDAAPPRSLSITGVDGAYSGQTSGNSRTHLLLENNAANILEFLNPAGSAAGVMWSNQTAQNRAGIIFDSDVLFFSQGGYDRAVIRSDGAFQTSDTNALVDFDSGGNRVRDASLWGYTLRCEGTSGNPHGHLVTYNAASPDSGASYPFYFTDSTAARFYVTSAGNIWTSDHGTITSDETLKENIVDATPKLADIMKLKVRNFNWKKSYKPNTPEKMLGFIAQEVEEVFPSLIKESDIAPRTSAKDDENHVSNMKKSVVAGALIPVLVKAMQEQQALIETLQTKVKALEET